MAETMDLQIDNELSSVIDQTAMILVSMKNDPTPPSSPIPHSSPRSHSPTTTSSVCKCMLCTRAAPIILSKCHTWAWIMRVVFYSLREKHPEKKFFSLKNDVYDYMNNHWNILGLDRKPSANWHKQIQDMLSHSRNIFESGMTHFKQNGFWRLKDLEDPWTARPDTPRPPSTTPPLTPTAIPSSPRKRGWKTTNSDEEQEQDDVHMTLKKLCTPPTSPRLTLSALHAHNNHSLDSLQHSSSSSSVSSACSSRPSSPLSSISSPNPLKASEELEKLREQLNHMTESIAQLSTDTPTSSPAPSPTPSHPLQHSFTPSVFSHNRVWEDSYSFQQHPVQA